MMDVKSSMATRHINHHIYIKISHKEMNTISTLLIFTICNSAALFYGTSNILPVLASDNITFKHTNNSGNTIANINCTNFQYNVSCRSVCKPPQQVCPSQASPNDTSVYNGLGQLQKH
jgi:hypothetical protein